MSISLADRLIWISNERKSGTVLGMNLFLSAECAPAGAGGGLLAGLGGLLGKLQNGGWPM